LAKEGKSRNTWLQARISDEREKSVRGVGKGREGREEGSYKLEEKERMSA